jgi:hypothetical protein
MEDPIYTAARRLGEFEMREVIDRLFNNGSLIGVVLNAREDECRISEPGIIFPDTENYITPCTFDVVLTRRPSAAELTALWRALKFSRAAVPESYEELVDSIRYEAQVSFVIVNRTGGSRWLNGEPVNTSVILDYVAKHQEKVAAVARTRAEKQRPRPPASSEADK